MEHLVLSHGLLHTALGTVPGSRNQSTLGEKGGHLRLQHVAQAMLHCPASTGRAGVCAWVCVRAHVCACVCTTGQLRASPTLLCT